MPIALYTMLTSPGGISLNRKSDNFIGGIDVILLSILFSSRKSVLAPDSNNGDTVSWQFFKELWVEYRSGTQRIPIANLGASHPGVQIGNKTLYLPSCRLYRSSLAQIRLPMDPSPDLAYNHLHANQHTIRSHCRAYRRDPRRWASSASPDGYADRYGSHPIPSPREIARKIRLVFPLGMHIRAELPWEAMQFHH